jgi:hypothetical protein
MTSTTATVRFPLSPMAPPAPTTKLLSISPPPSLSPARAIAATGTVDAAIVTQSRSPSRSSSTVTTPPSHTSSAWPGRALR